MKQIERIGLIDRIGRELQARMSYGEISAYLRGFGVDTKKETSGVNSKWVFVKDLLGDASPGLVVQIADDLEIPHKYVVSSSKAVTESSFWEAQHFRLFLSHLASFKVTAGALQGALRRFGISAFVAHVDIVPTREWQDEIEAALFSMDALAVILMPGAKESSWIDQEVGFAVGRDVLVVPIIRGLDPYGFIAKYQGLQAAGKTVTEVANGLFGILLKSTKTRARILSCMVGTLLGAPTEQVALERLDHLSRVSDLPRGYVEQLRDWATQSPLVAGSGQMKQQINKLLESHGLSPLQDAPSPMDELTDDDIPF
jgi:TIR domain